MDFAEGFYNNRKRQIGKCGISDKRRLFHPLVYGIFNSENSEDATQLLQMTTQLLDKIANVISDRTLTDGSKALKNAITSLNMTAKDCFSHLGRPLGSRGSGKHGTNGSLSRYLLDRGVSLSIINHILHIFLGIRHFTTLADWQSGRKLFFKYFSFLSAKEFSHFQMFYLPMVPRWGVAYHKRGEVQSTNGLELDWKPMKKSCDIEKKFSANKNEYLINMLSAISNR